MNAKTLFKTVFATAILVLLVLMGMHNRTPVDFSLLPLRNQSLHGPVAFMYFAFFGIGMLTGMVMSIRGGRKQAPPHSGPISIPSSPRPATTMTPRVGATSEPPIGSRIS